MRVPDELRDCTCFLSCVRGETYTASGTAFFLGVEVGIGDQSVVYAVTARHCLYDDEGEPEELVLLLNRNDGGIGVIESTPSDWTHHPSADVAIMLVPASRLGGFRIRVYPYTSLATPAFRTQREIGAGDEVFMTGLLVHHPGVTEIIPIARIGSIAALPVDPIALKLGRHQTAVLTEDVVGLMEIRSIGGLSGSPVYLHLPFWRDVEKGTMFVGHGATAASPNHSRRYANAGVGADRGPCVGWRRLDSRL